MTLYTSYLYSTQGSKETFYAAKSNQSTE